MVLQESKGSVAVRMALGETQIVQETRQFLLDNSVCLDSFSQVCDMIWTNSIRSEKRKENISRVCTGCSTEEHHRDPGEKPSSRSGIVGVGGAVLSPRLVGPGAAAAFGTHGHRRVPRSDRGQTSLHSTGVQQGVLNARHTVVP